MDAVLQRIENTIGLGRWRIFKNGPSYWSPGMFRIAGLEPQPTPPSFSEFQYQVSPKDRIKMRDLLNACYAKGQAITATIEVIRPDGDVREVEYTGSPILDFEGDCIGISGSAFDRTDDLAAIQDKLQGNNAIRDFLDMSDRGLISLDKKGRATFVNKRMLGYLGKTEKEIVHQHLAQVWENVPKEVYVAIHDVLATGQQIWSEPVEVVLNGERYWVKWWVSPWTDNENRNIGCVLAVADITEHLVPKMDAISDLEAIEQGLKLAQTVTWEIDVEAKSLMVYGEHGKFLVEDPKPSDLSNFVCNEPVEEDRLHVVKAWKQHLKNGHPLFLCFRRKSMNGNVEWVSFMSRVIADSSGRKKHIKGAIRDISGMVAPTRGDGHLFYSPKGMTSANFALLEVLGASLVNETLSVRGQLQQLRLRIDAADSDYKPVENLIQSTEKLTTLAREISVYSSGEIEHNAEEFDVRAVFDGVLGANLEADEYSEFEWDYTNVGGKTFGNSNSYALILTYALKVLYRKFRQPKAHMHFEFVRRGKHHVLRAEFTRNIGAEIKEIDLQDLTQQADLGPVRTVLCHQVAKLNGEVKIGELVSGEGKLEFILPIRFADKRSMFVGTVTDTSRIYVLLRKLFRICELTLFLRKTVKKLFRLFYLMCLMSL